MSATFRVALAGQTVPFRFSTVSFAGIRELVAADVEQDISARAAKAQNGADFADTNAARLNLGVGLFKTLALAEAATIPAGVTAVRLDGRTTAGVGGATFVRTSLADITSAGYPASSYFRSTDRLLPDGTTDATNGGYWLLKEKEVTPLMLGAVGDASDESTLLNALAVYASIAKATIIIPDGYTFGISADNWLLLNGIKAVEGRGGTIKLVQTSGTRSIILKGVTAGAASNVFDLTIRNVVLDANGKQTLGFYGQNCARCNFLYNQVLNNTSSTGFGIFLKSFPDGGTECTENKVIGNVIKGSTGATGEGSIGIVVTGAQTTPYGGYADAIEEWKATFTNAAATLSATRNIVALNTVDGHYYSIHVAFGNGNIISGNTCRNNVRGISLQGHASRNVVSDNTILENTSTAIHVAYSSSHNKISGNLCHSTVCSSTSEGLFQAYVGCTDNDFTNNKGYVTGTGPAYFCYTAVHANRNTFSGNVYYGPARKAYMAAESAWDTTSANAASRGNGASTAVNNFANASSANNDFTNNIITPTSAVPAMFLGQVSDGGANSPYALTFITMQNNRIKGSTYSMLLSIMEETSGSCNSLYFRDNVHGATSSKFTLPRGRAHFTELADPLFDDNQTEISFTDGDTTPSVAFGRSFKTANTGATSITDFDDGRDGQVIDIRLDANTTIVHNSALIRNRAGVNLVGTANLMVSYKSLLGIWWQLY